jgi:hypothetical protein
VTTVAKIVSGAQTGADRAGLDVAMELGIATGGWVPRGRRAEDGTIPARYSGLEETESTDYAVRTRRNVRDSDATLIVTFGPPTGGTALTVASARSLRKPVLVLDLDLADAAAAAGELRRWLGETRPRVLNVAGPRLSKAPRIAAATAQVLRAALRPDGSAPRNPAR